jgi:glycosyltransferase involved in cell wall biosynthesis
LTGSGPKSLFFNYIDNRFIDLYILGNERIRKVYEEHTNLDKIKFSVVNEGVDSNPNNLHKKKESKSVMIGIIGSYEKRKGHNILFKAVDILNQYSDLNKFKIICFGQSKYGHYYNIIKMAKNMGIDHLVEFNEYEEDMDKLYLPLDIIVSPSTTFEAMPLVLIDAMAYCKPVIGSKLQGIMEIIDHGSNGYLFDIGDYRTMAKYLKILIMDDKKRNSFGIYGRKRYEDNFTAQRMAQDSFKVFMS